MTKGAFIALFFFACYPTTKLTSTLKQQNSQAKQNLNVLSNKKTHKHTQTRKLTSTLKQQNSQAETHKKQKRHVRRKQHTCRQSTTTKITTKKGNNEAHKCKTIISPAHRVLIVCV